MVIERLYFLKSIIQSGFPWTDRIQRRVNWSLWQEPACGSIRHNQRAASRATNWKHKYGNAPLTGNRGGVPHGKHCWDNGFSIYPRGRKELQKVSGFHEADTPASVPGLYHGHSPGLASCRAITASCPALQAMPWTPVFLLVICSHPMGGYKRQVTGIRGTAVASIFSAWCSV